MLRTNSNGPRTRTPRLGSIYTDIQGRKVSEGDGIHVSHGGSCPSPRAVRRGPYARRGPYGTLLPYPYVGSLLQGPDTAPTLSRRGPQPLTLLVRLSPLSRTFVPAVRPTPSKPLLTEPGLTSRAPPPTDTPGVRPGLRPPPPLTPQDYPVTLTGLHVTSSSTVTGLGQTFWGKDYLPPV